MDLRPRRAARAAAAAPSSRFDAHGELPRADVLVPRLPDGRADRPGERTLIRAANGGMATSATSRRERRRARTGRPSPRRRRRRLTPASSRPGGPAHRSPADRPALPALDLLVRHQRDLGRPEHRAPGARARPSRRPARRVAQLAFLDIFAVIVAVAVQPTVGSISDYTISRWGRRKPYIAIGSVLDVVFLIGIATSQTYLSIFAFVVLLQFSSNFAQGPFQGYMPGPRAGGAGRLRERARRRDVDPRRDRRHARRLDRLRARLVHAADHRARPDRARDGDRHGPVGPRGARPEGPRGPVMARPSRARRGASTCCGSGASCGWSDRACSSWRGSPC